MMDLFLGGVVLVVIIALVLLSWVDWSGPDDDWMLDNAHRLRHRYRPGMEPGSWDERQQQAAAERRDKRDEAVGKVHLAHSSPAKRLRRVG